MIPIRNIYYMLAYAFRDLKERGSGDVAVEEFDNVTELYAEILLRGIAAQVKRGLDRAYIPRTEPLSCLRGKPEIADSVRRGALMSHEMVCTHHDFSANSRANRILKSTILLLLRSSLSRARKKALRGLMAYFDGVEEVDLRRVDWNAGCSRNNQAYQELIGVCRLVAKGLLQSRLAGTVGLKDFEDAQKEFHLYERFLLGYYRREFRELHAKASRIDWQLDKGSDPDTFLPGMRTDILLAGEKKVLIIDAKYYASVLLKQQWSDSRAVRSAHLYQIFAYVKNKQVEQPDQEVSGVLLYARTDEAIELNERYRMSGSLISVKTLDLNREFPEIKEQLNQIVHDHFPSYPH